MVRVLLSLISLVSIKTEAITFGHKNARPDFRACVCFTLSQVCKTSVAEVLKCERAGKILGSHSNLEVVVAGQGNEEVEEETLAVFIDLWSVVVQTCSAEYTTR